MSTPGGSKDKMEDKSEGDLNMPPGRLSTDCRGFLDMSRNQRWDFVRNKNLCYCCLDDHTVRSCRLTRICGVDVCKKIHHALLHAYQAVEDETVP